MKIGVLSDSHDNLPMIDAAMRRFAEAGVEAVLHAGDVISPFAARRLTGPLLPAGAELLCVYGNNDGERAGLAKVLEGIADGPVRAVLEGGRTIVMTHDAAGLTDADTAAADIVISGHSHEIVNETVGGTLHLNPGECGGWLTGRCTAAIIDTDTDTISAEIIDLA